MKAAVRGLASGEKGYEKFPKLFREKFVFLNVYCKSVKEEHDPRGPEGPYRFQDRSVPVVVFKRWDGETLKQQLGFNPNAEVGKKSLAQMVEKALKDNGPVSPPKALKPLLKSMDKARDNLDKGRIYTAIKELQKIVKAGADSKKFKDGTPTVAEDARKMLDQIAADARTRIEAAAENPDPDKAVKSLKALLRDYSPLDEVKAAIKETIAEIEGDLVQE